jgi:hypothetical protein
MKRAMAVINWENVLVPLDWMIAHLGIGPSTASIDQEVILSLTRSSPELVRTFAAIEDGTFELLTETLRSVNGPVFIVSEYTTVYVEFVCSLVFPRLTAALRSATTGIYVIGTPDTQLTTLEMNRWKANLLWTVIHERVLVDMKVADAANQLVISAPGTIEVVALCASTADVEAVSTISSFAPSAVIKSLKAKVGQTNCTTHPLGSPLGLDEFYEQLHTLTRFVKHAVAVSRPISIAL